MKEQEQVLIDELKSNIKQLVELNEARKAELQQAKSEMSVMQSRFEQLQNEHEMLNKRFENLKVAKSLEMSETDNEAAKQKISKIVREIDKCIALLNN